MIADLVQGFALQSKNNNSTTPSGVVVRFKRKFGVNSPSRRTYSFPSISHQWAEIKNSATINDSGFGAGASTYKVKITTQLHQAA